MSNEAQPVANLLVDSIVSSTADGKPIAVLLTLATCGHCHAARKAWETIANDHPHKFRMLWIEDAIRLDVARLLQQVQGPAKRAAAAFATAFSTTSFPKLLRWAPGTTKPAVQMGFVDTDAMCKFIAGKLPMPRHTHAS
jgi:hypothetical protein